MKTTRILMSICLAVGAVRAEVWIMPMPLTPSAGQRVMLRLEAGEGETQGNFQHVWKRGRRNLHAADLGFDTRGDGVHLVTFESPPAADARGHHVQRFAKALVVVGAPPAGSPLRWSEVGQRLEIVPQTDPVALLRGESRLEVQVLYDREPLAGARVEAVPPGGAGEVRAARTDEIGVAAVLLDRAGHWRVRVAYRGRCDTCEPPVMELLTSTLVLAVR